MVLNHYAFCSENKLIEQLNSNIGYQFYCDCDCDFHLGFFLYLIILK